MLDGYGMGTGGTGNAVECRKRSGSTCPCAEVILVDSDPRCRLCPRMIRPVQYDISRPQYDICCDKQWGTCACGWAEDTDVTAVNIRCSPPSLIDGTS